MDNVISKILPRDVSARYVAQVLTEGGASTNGGIERCLRAPPFYAIVPDGIDDVTLLNFDRGGVLSAPPAVQHAGMAVQRVPNTIPAAAAIVHDVMTRLDQGVLLVHEPMLTEAELVSKHIPYELITGEIYLVSAHDADERGIATLIRYALQSWHFLGFVVERSREINSVDDLVASANLMLVGAYDGESFLYSVRAPACAGELARTRQA